MKSGSSSLSRIAEGPLRSRGGKPAQAVGKTGGEASEWVAAAASRLEVTLPVSEGDEAPHHERSARRRTSLDELMMQSFIQPVEAHARREVSARRQQEPATEASSQALAPPARSAARAPQGAQDFGGASETRSAREPEPRRDEPSAPGATQGEHKARPTARATASSRVVEQSESEVHDATLKPSRRVATGPQSPAVVDSESDRGPIATSDAQSAGSRLRPGLQRHAPLLSRLFASPVAPSDEAHARREPSARPQQEPATEAHARREPSAQRQQKPATEAHARREASARPQQDATEASSQSLAPPARSEARAPQGAQDFGGASETRSAREPEPRRDEPSAPGATQGEHNARPTARATASSRVAEQSESEAHDAMLKRSRRVGTGSQSSRVVDSESDRGTVATTDAQSSAAGVRAPGLQRHAPRLTRTSVGPIAPSDEPRAQPSKPRSRAPAGTARPQAPKAAREVEASSGAARSAQTPRLAGARHEPDTRPRAPHAGSRAAGRSDSQRAEAEPAVTATRDERRVSRVNPRTTSAPVSARAEPRGGIAKRTGPSEAPARIAEHRGERQSGDQKAATRTLSLPEATLRAPARRATPAPTERAAPRAPSATPVRAALPATGHTERPPSVTVTIGRVEIRGTRPATPKPQPPRRAASARAHSIAPNYPGAL